MQRNKDGELKLFKLFGHFSLITLLGTSLLYGGSFEDFKRTQSESFKKYKDERDSAFNNYLKEEFKAYKASITPNLYEEPKPKTIPQAPKKESKGVGPKVHLDIQKIKTQPTNTPPVQQQKVQKYDKYIDFFGSKIGFNVSSGIEKARYYPYNQKGIVNFFDTAASSEYKELLLRIQTLCKEMNLNDWGVYLLVNKIALNISQNSDDAKLLSWFLFNKLGYAVKVGIASKHIVLLHYSKKIIYATPNYTFGKKRYYVIANYAKGRVGRLYSYKHDYPDATKPLDLALRSLPIFASDTQKRDLKFLQDNQEYSIDFEYNKNLIDFMATYPQADYATYFNAPLEDETYRTLAQSLKHYVDSKHISEAMNFVLHFVQKAFVYERDDEQFGREKVMFAEETLYYKKSDCEDRAVLYAYLMKELFGISVIGVKYKDHMATALYVPMDGDTIKENGKKFVIADPTYINASIGQSMPKYRSIRPESFIVVAKN